MTNKGYTLKTYCDIMKKIMFNDKYGLTAAVLNGRKKQTRRIINLTLHEKSGKLLKEVLPEEIFLYEGAWLFKYKGKIYDMPKESRPKYKVDEVVAVAQSYHDIYDEFGLETMDMLISGLKYNKGWNNKMFVASNFMPHKIRITNVRIQRLQDISDEDCLMEWIEFDGFAQKFYCAFNKSTNSKIWLGRTSREAYADLINKVSGKGTWESNPWVWVYDFELLE